MRGAIQNPHKVLGFPMYDSIITSPCGQRGWKWEMYLFIPNEEKIQLHFQYRVCCGAALYYGQGALSRAPISSKASCMTWRSGDGGEERRGEEEVLFLKRVASLIAPPPTSLSSPLKPRVHLCTARWKTQSGRRRKEGEKNNHRSPLKPQVRPRPRSVVRPAIFDSVTGHGDGHACHDSRWR